VDARIAAIADAGGALVVIRYYRLRCVVEVVLAAGM
jgi:hypothetical protein